MEDSVHGEVTAGEFQAPRQSGCGIWLLIFVDIEWSTEPNFPSRIQWFLYTCNSFPAGLNIGAPCIFAVGTTTAREKLTLIFKIA